MQLKGWQCTSLIDFPGHIATVLFTGGCNFRCPMCHNADLVLRPEALPSIPAAQVMAHLEQRAGMITGVVITGGEPTLQPDLGDFIAQLKHSNDGLAIKLDTNGYRPDVLAALLDEGLVDYVAMDVKAPPEKYAQLAGREPNRFDVTRIERSINLIRENQRPYEFRTTVVPSLLTASDIEIIARWLDGAETYILQQFRAQGILNPTLAGITPYATAELAAMAERARRWLPTVKLRGA